MGTAEEPDILYLFIDLISSHGALFL